MKSVFVYAILIMLAVIMSGSCAADPETEHKMVMVEKKTKVSLGVVITDVDKETLEKFDLKGGAEILKVIDDSEAERIGLKKGDIIVKFAGKDIENPSDVKELISEMEDNGEVEIIVMRNGKRQTFQAKLEPAEIDDFIMHFDDDFNFDKFKILPDMFKGRHWFGGKGGFLGVYARNISDQLKEYFNVEHGVLIEKVIEDSPAEKAGLEAGDIILNIEDKKIEDYEDLVRTLNYYDPEDKVKVKYSRKGSTKTVDVVLGSKKLGKKKMLKLGDVDKFLVKPEVDILNNFKIDKEKLPEIKERLKDFHFDINAFII